jgi:hypothetical protein
VQITKNFAGDDSHKTRASCVAQKFRKNICAGRQRLFGIKGDPTHQRREGPQGLSQGQWRPRGRNAASAFFYFG